MKPGARFAAVFLRGLFKVFLRVEVRGKEYIPPSGPVMVVCNHLHLADPPILILSLLPRASRFMAKQELFDSRFYGPVMRLAEAFPVPQGGRTRDMEQLLQQAGEVLNQGLILGMFPEGTRSRDGKLGRGFSGVASIAVRSGAQVLPVGIAGTEKIRGTGWFKRPRVTVAFGKPFYLEAEAGALSRSQLRALTDSVMEKIAELLPPEYRRDPGGASPNES